MTPITERLRVVLVSPRNPLNIGAAARALSNFGFGTLRLVNPYDVAFREAKSAVGPAADLLARATEHASVADAVHDCSLIAGTMSLEHRERKHPIARLEDAAARIHHEPGNIALLFGSEKFGLSNEDLAHCHLVLHIPTRIEHESMNLGQAVAVCLYELSRRDAVTAVEIEPGASAAQVQLITARLLDALTISGYVNDVTRESAELKLQRLVRRLHIPANDASTWAGIFKQILWKLRNPG